MDLRQLRHIVALADHRSFVRAADAVSLSQPAFSRSIQTLERDVGCTLVERSSREFRLTGQGQLVVQHARRLLAASRSLHNELVQYNGLTGGELHFGSGPYPAQLLVPQALAEFVHAHPAIQTRYLLGDWDQLAQLLKEEQIEFLVGDARFFTGDPQYQVQLLRPRLGRFFCRQGHPLAGRVGPTLDALLDYPVAGTRVPPMIRKILADIQGVPDFRVTVDCAQFDTIVKVVLNSDAVGIATDEALADLVATDAIHLLRFADVPSGEPALSLQYGVVHRAGHSLSPAAQALVQILVAVDQRLLTE